MRRNKKEPKTDDKNNADGVMTVQKYDISISPRMRLKIQIVLGIEPNAANTVIYVFDHFNMDAFIKFN